MIWMSAAWGCFCPTPSYTLLPEPNDFSVPLNAQITVISHGISGTSPTLWLDATPVPGEHVVQRTPDATRYTFVPDVHLLPERTYTVELEAGGTYDFDTGLAVDVTPPTLNGIEVSSRRDSRDCLGTFSSHHFSVTGVRGEYGPSRVWTVAEPIDEALPAVMAMGTAVLAYAGETCATTDGTLWDVWHRAYTVQVVDVAGNRTNVPVQTRGKGQTVDADGRVTSRTGCTMGRPPPAWSAGGLWARRR